MKWNRIAKSIKKFYLAKYDEDMNQLWYKEYGGDRAYIFVGLHILEDGGCLAYGYITDTIESIRHAYIMQVDVNGEMITSSTIPRESLMSIQVTSLNNSTLCVINPDGVAANIVLYDMHGREILNGEINSEMTEFSVTGLTAGLYPYLLIHGGHVIASGKWIKGM